MATVVGLDVGTTAVKALALSEDGEILARAEREYGLSTPRPGWSEQDPYDWWERHRARAATTWASTAPTASGSRARCTASSRSTPPAA